MTAASPIITITNISKTFPNTPTAALSNISATIPKGEIVGLVGPDGAGKTTLIRLIAGLLTPTTGAISVGGLDTVKDAPRIPCLIGYMPQKFGLYEDLTVMQNLDLYADLQGVVGEARVHVIEKLLSFTKLGPFTDRLAGALSGGMKQKLGLACALIRTPQCLLLDEPSVGVDPISRRELWKMVHNLLEDGLSVIWSTAYLDEAEKCSTVLLLNEGKLLYQGTASAMTKRVEGRTFRITDIAGQKRDVLAKILKLPDIIDATIQGSDVRIVTTSTTPALPPTLHILPTEARFEDAFIDILGGCPKGESQLAAHMPETKETKQAIVEAKGLTKKFGSFVAANSITFDIMRGEIFGLLGPNGAGKSTTFKMLCGLLQPTTGSSFVSGVSLQEAPSEARSHIGYMAQKFSLYGDLSVSQNLYFFSGAYNLANREQSEACSLMTNIFHLQPFLNMSAREIPLGFKQRLSLACAAMHRPAVLFLDEPTSGVDPLTRREFWNHINGLVQKGVTILVTTHFMDEAEYCDRIALVYAGKIITIGTPDSLKAEVRTQEMPAPTLEDAFIAHIQQFDSHNNKVVA